MKTLTAIVLLLALIGGLQAGDSAFAESSRETSKPLRQASTSAKATADRQGRPNILFIAADDLRPELGCYGSEIAITQISML